MATDFDGKTILVTGAASGLGYDCARGFLARGGKVAMVDIDHQAAENAAAELGSEGGEAWGLGCDVTDALQVDEIMQAVVERWGHLDIAVNNAGVSSPLKPVAETEESDFDKVIGVNLKGVWLCMRAELRQMLSQGSGSIVNMASALSLRVFEGGSFYVASKFAVAGMTRTAAVEYARSGIRVNAVCPGNVATPLMRQAVDDETFRQLSDVNAMKRMGEPEEITSAVLWLASDEASFNTGTLLTVDGGWTAQ